MSLRRGTVYSRGNDDDKQKKETIEDDPLYLSMVDKYPRLKSYKLAEKHPTLLLELLFEYKTTGRIEPENMDAINSWYRARNEDEVIFSLKSQKQFSTLQKIEMTLLDENDDGIDDPNNPCRACGCTRSVYRIVQDRSGDEAMSSYFRCVQCRKERRA